MRASTLVSVLTLGIAAGSASPIDGDGGVCATAGRICGPVPCVPQNGSLYFTCDCGKDQYFNATAQRCYHVGNCITEPCPSGICRDNDGRSARTCDCSDVKHLTRDCKVEKEFHEACSKYKAGVTSNEEGEIVCTCPPGMKFNGDDCESYACGVTAFTCKEICNYKPYREDQRCCQGWDISCDASYEENTYCKPGTIPAGKNPKDLNCTNICAMDESPCEHRCTYKDPKSPYFACTCPEGKVISGDGYTCRDKTECDDHEKEDCTKKGQRCVVEDRRAVCKCPADQVLVDGACRASCTEPKKSTCATILSQCKIIDNVETCVCDRPLIWNEAEKKCVLEKQFIYQVQFEMDKYPTVHTQAWWDNAEIEIEHAMKNLYGKSLRRTELVQSGKTPTVEMNFAEEPENATLNRIFQCHEHIDADKCYFAPDLYIVKATATAPASIDICTRYLQESSLFHKEGLKCHNDGNGEYSLRCREKNSLPPAKYGALTVVQCEVPGGPNSAERFTSTSAALLIGILIPAVLVGRRD